MPASVGSSGPGRNSPVGDRMGPVGRPAPGILVNAGESSSRGGGATEVGGVNNRNPGFRGAEGWSRQNGDNGDRDRRNGGSDREDGDRVRVWVDGGWTSRRTLRSNGFPPASRARRRQTQLHQARMDELFFDRLRSDERPAPNIGVPETFASYPAYNLPTNFRVGGRRSWAAQLASGRDDDDMDMDMDIDLGPFEPQPIADDEVAIWYETTTLGYNRSSLGSDIAGIDQNPAVVIGNHPIVMPDDSEEEWYRMRRGEQAMYRRLALHDRYDNYLRSQQRR